jgi:hypothetical protein
MLHFVQETVDEWSSYGAIKGTTNSRATALSDSLVIREQELKVGSATIDDAHQVAIQVKIRTTRVATSLYAVGEETLVTQLCKHATRANRSWSIATITARMANL